MWVAPVKHLLSRLCQCRAAYPANHSCFVFGGLTEVRRNNANLEELYTAATAWQVRHMLVKCIEQRLFLTMNAVTSLKNDSSSMVSWNVVMDWEFHILKIQKWKKLRIRSKRSFRGTTKSVLKAPWLKNGLQWFISAEKIHQLVLKTLFSTFLELKFPNGHGQNDCCIVLYKCVDSV